MNKINSEKYKKYIKRILISLFTVLTIIAIFNVLMDPYNVFGTPDFGFNRLKPDAKRQERLTKIIGLKLDKRKLDAVFVGTSRTDWPISKAHYKEVTGKNAENMAVVGMGFDEYLELADLCVKLHPEIKKVYLGLDLYTFNKNYKDNQKHIPFDTNTHLTTQELATVLFAGDTTVSSFITLARNTFATKDPSKMYTRMGTTHRFYNKGIKVYFDFAFRKYYEHYDNYLFNEENYEKLRLLKYNLKKQGVDLIMFHTPGHITDIDVIYENNMWKTFTDWKKGLTNVADVWDFYYYNYVTDSEVKPDMEYFTDAAHASDIAGKMMIETMTKSKNNGFGRLNTSKNIDKYMTQDLDNLRNWRRKNPEWIKKIQAQKGVYLKLKAEGKL